MNVIIAGSRGFVPKESHPQYRAHWERAFDHIDAAVAEWETRYPTPAEIVSGTAPGIDRVGEVWAEQACAAVRRMPASWTKPDGSKDKGAGMKRNAQMAVYSDAAILVWDGKSSGTLNMITEMKNQGRPTLVYQPRLGERGFTWYNTALRGAESIVIPAAARKVPPRGRHREVSPRQGAASWVIAGGRPAVTSIASAELPFFVFDTETWLIQPGLAVPKMVCAQHLWWDAAKGGPDFDAGEIRLDPWAVWEALQHPKTIFGGVNIAFDFRVISRVLRRHGIDAMPAIFKAYQEGRVREAMIREKLELIRDGRTVYDHTDNNRKNPQVSMAAMASRRLGMDMKDAKSKDSWRMRYWMLDGIPVHDWPQEAYEYAYNDVVTAARILMDQHADVYSPEEEAKQTYVAWALGLSSTHGMRTDPERVAWVEAALNEKIEFYQKRLRSSGIYDEEGKRNLTVLRDYVTAAFDGDPPMTDGGKKGIQKVQYGYEVLVEAATLSGNEVLQDAARLGKYDSLKSKFLKVLKLGTEYPITPFIDALKVTGRTSYSKPNLQQIPRGDKEFPEGVQVRKCFIPSEGRVFIGSDYSNIELRALAEINMSMFGYSRMADAFNLGRDLHTQLAAQLAGVEYDEMVRLVDIGDAEAEEFRQFAKVANFGFPGGLQPKNFVDYAAGFGIDLTLEKAQWLYDLWFSIFPEMELYFDWAKSLLPGWGDPATIEQHISGRIRGDCQFTQIANTMFQGLAVDGAKEALISVTEACYLESVGSVLFGSRIGVFVHDEIILDAIDDGKGHEKGMELDRLMREGMMKYIKSVPVLTDPVMMMRWEKKAKPTFDTEGRLTYWEAKPGSDPLEMAA